MSMIIKYFEEINTLATMVIIIKIILLGLYFFIILFFSYYIVYKKIKIERGFYVCLDIIAGKRVWPDFGFFISGVFG